MKKTERKRKSKGCYDYTTKQYRNGGFLYKSCYGNYVSNIDFYIEAFSFFEKGKLPYTGTLGEQPNKIIEIFNIIHSRREEVLQQKENTGA